MMKPTIHLNGTSAEGLILQLREACDAINSAREALDRAAPHGRDYYPQGNGAINQAINEHLQRRTKLSEVYDELYDIWEHVDQSR